MSTQIHRGIRGQTAAMFDDIKQADVLRIEESIDELCCGFVLYMYYIDDGYNLHCARRSCRRLGWEYPGYGKAMAFCKLSESEHCIIMISTTFMTILISLQSSSSLSLVSQSFA